MGQARRDRGHAGARGARDPPGPARTGLNHVDAGRGAGADTDLRLQHRGLMADGQAAVNTVVPPELRAPMLHTRARRLSGAINLRPSPTRRAGEPSSTTTNRRAPYRRSSRRTTPTTSSATRRPTGLSDGRAPPAEDSRQPAGRDGLSIRPSRAGRRNPRRPRTSRSRPRRCCARSPRSCPRRICSSRSRRRRSRFPSAIRELPPPAVLATLRVTGRRRPRARPSKSRCWPRCSRPRARRSGRSAQNATRHGCAPPTATRGSTC